MNGAAPLLGTMLSKNVFAEYGGVNVSGAEVAGLVDAERDAVALNLEPGRHRLDRVRAATGDWHGSSAGKARRGRDAVATARASTQKSGRRAKRRAA